VDFLKEQPVPHHLRRVRTNRGEDKGQQYSRRSRDKTMIRRTQQEKLDKGSHSRQFPANLPVPHPLGKKQCQTAGKNDSQIQGGQSELPIKQKKSQKDGRANLVACPDQNGEIQKPVGPVTDPSHFMPPALRGFMLISHHLQDSLSLIFFIYFSNLLNISRVVSHEPILFQEKIAENR